jgi:hypothetical protein
MIKNPTCSEHAQKVTYYCLYNKTKCMRKNKQTVQRGNTPAVLEKEELHPQEKGSLLCWPACKELWLHQVVASGLKSQEAQEVNPILHSNKKKIRFFFCVKFQITQLIRIERATIINEYCSLVIWRTKMCKS